MVTPGSPRKQSVLLGRLSQAVALCSREKKNHGLRHGGNTRLLHPENQKSERIISIEWIHDVATKRISSRRHFPYLYFENIYHIVPFKITFKYHTYTKSIICQIPFSNQILSKIKSISNHTYIDFDYIKSLSKLSTFQINRFQINFILIQSILYRFDHSQIKCLII